MKDVIELQLIPSFDESEKQMGAAHYFTKCIAKTLDLKAILVIRKVQSYGLIVLWIIGFNQF